MAVYLHHNNSDNNTKIRQTQQSAIKKHKNYKSMAHKPQNLQQYYESLSQERGTKAVFQQEVMKACDCSVTSIRNWCTGVSKASKYKHLRVLSKVTGISIDNLFKTV